MLRGLGGSDPAGRRLFLRVIAAFVAAVLGKLFDEKIEELLFGLWPVVAAWAVGGVVILFVARSAPASIRCAESRWRSSLAAPS